jgi:hypothetical protein
MRVAGKMTIIMIMAWLVFAPANLLAIDPVPMPDFQLITLDGQTIKSSDLPAAGSWLLIYVQPTSHYCDQLLKTFTKDRYPSLPASAVFIVNGSADDAKNMKAKYPDLASASWYADPGKAAFAQLKLHGVPVMLGIRDSKIQWTLNGILPDDKTMQSILTSWIQK